MTPPPPPPYELPTSTFPVPESKLPTIHITPQQHEELRTFAVHAAREVLMDGPSWARTNVQSAMNEGWKIVRWGSEMCYLTKRTKRHAPLRFGRQRKQQWRHQQQLDSSVSRSSLSSSTSSSSSLMSSATGHCIMGHAKFPNASLEDVMNSAYAESTQELREHLASLYGGVYLDSGVIETLETANAKDPFWYLGLKWLAIKSPIGKLLSSREFVYLEHTGTHVTSHGRRMLYRVIQSVNLSDYGGQDSYFGLTRAHVEAAFVYWIDRPQSPPVQGVSASTSGRLSSEDDQQGVLNMCMKGRGHLKGKLPLWVLHHYMKKFWRSGRVFSTLRSEPQDSDPFAAEAAMSTLAREGRSRSPLGLASKWVADEDREECFVCHKKFHFVRRLKHHCRACGEVICSQCAAYKQLNVPAAHHRDTQSALRPLQSAPFLVDPEQSLQSDRSNNIGMDEVTETPLDALHKTGLTSVTMGKVCLRCTGHDSMVRHRSPPQEPQRLRHTASAPQLLMIYDEAAAWAERSRHGGDMAMIADEMPVLIGSIDENEKAALLSNSLQREIEYPAAYEHQQHGEDSSEMPDILSITTDHSLGEFRSSIVSKSEDPRMTIDELTEPTSHETELEPVSMEDPNSSADGDLGGQSAWPYLSFCSNQNEINQQTTTPEEVFPRSSSRMSSASLISSLQVKRDRSGTLTSATVREQESLSLSSFNPDGLFDFAQPGENDSFLVRVRDLQDDMLRSELLASSAGSAEPSALFSPAPSASSYASMQTGRTGLFNEQFSPREFSATDSLDDFGDLQSLASSYCSSSTSSYK